MKSRSAAVLPLLFLALSVIPAAVSSPIASASPDRQINDDGTTIVDLYTGYQYKGHQSLFVHPNNIDTKCQKLQPQEYVNPFIQTQLCQTNLRKWTNKNSLEELEELEELDEMDIEIGSIRFIFNLEQ
jgi:hypothetical protein